MTASRRRYAFSLLELLVVIGLITVLGSLLLIGVGRLINNSKRQQTQLAFQNAQAMFSEWDTVTRQHFINYQDVTWSAMPAPQNVSATGNSRSSYSMLATRGMISQMRAMPVNATALGKLSAGAFTPLHFDVSSAATWSSGSSYSLLNLVYFQTSSVPPISYAYFVCIQPNTGAPLSDLRFWMPAGVSTNFPPSLPMDLSPPDSSDYNVPVLTDGWGNPILFVPGGVVGTLAALSAGPTPPLGSVVPGTGAIASGSGSSASSIAVRSPDARPFWASAGPDGDFSSGDDNMYSFEK